jgi:hypothetical protein
MVARAHDATPQPAQHVETTTMHGRIAKKAPNQADRILQCTYLHAYLPENVQAMAQESVARSTEFYRNSAAAAQGGARLFAEVAETAWGSAKLLNDKVAHNVTCNTEAAFNAAEAVAKASSLHEIVTLQGDFLRLLLAQTSEQTREFVDLATRATQHVLETMQGAAVRLMRTDL